MPKAYWISTYSEIHDADKMAAYGALALPALEAAGGRLLARNVAVHAFEGGRLERSVLIEFANADLAYAAHESPAYQEALAALDGGATRDIRIVEGVE